MANMNSYFNLKNVKVVRRFIGFDVFFNFIDTYGKKK